MSVLLKNDKIDEIKKCLEELNKKNGNKGCILCSEEGLVVISTKNGEKNNDFDSLAAMSANLLEIINEQVLLDVLVSYNNKKVFLRKINGTICNLIFINIFANDKRYFRREINKAIRRINKILNIN